VIVLLSKMRLSIPLDYATFFSFFLFFSGNKQAPRAHRKSIRRRPKIINENMIHIFLLVGIQPRTIKAKVSSKLTSNIRYFRIPLHIS
jgi:hypothetical protein